MVVGPVISTIHPVRAKTGFHFNLCYWTTIVHKGVGYNHKVGVVRIELT
jgi:hypothetical protein